MGFYFRLFDGFGLPLGFYYYHSDSLRKVETLMQTYLSNFTASIPEWFSLIYDFISTPPVSIFLYFILFFFVVRLVRQLLEV